MCERSFEDFKNSDINAILKKYLGLISASSGFVIYSIPVLDLSLLFSGNIIKDAKITELERVKL